MPKPATKRKVVAPPQEQPAPTGRFQTIADNCFRDTRRLYLNDQGVWCFCEYTPTLPDSYLPHAKCIELAQKCDLAGGGWELATREQLSNLFDTATDKLNAELGDRIKADWHWSKDAPSSSGSAWSVGFNDGIVDWSSRGSSGFVVASRLVPAGQF